MTKQQVSETTGAALVARIRAEMAAEGLEPDGRESSCWASLRALRTGSPSLRRRLRRGLTSTSKGGLVRLHPAVAAVRQTRSALARVLSGVQMSDGTKDPVKQAAAQARWRSHNEAKKRGYGG